MTSPYLLRPLRSLAEVSRAAPAGGSTGKASVSMPDMQSFLRSFIALHPASAEGRAASPKPIPRAENRAKGDAAKPARLVWTNESPPVRARRRDWRPRLEESES